VDDWFMQGGHYSPAGNAIVGRWLGRELLGAAPPTVVAGR
jgi:hypothetical protein